MKKSINLFLLSFLFSVVFFSCNKDNPVTSNGGGSSTGNVTNTFTKTDSVNINLGETNDFLTVDSTGTISSFNFSLNRIENVSANNIDIFLLHGGVIDTLLYMTSNTGTNFIGTIFSDTAAQSIQNGSGNFTGYFKPYRPLSKFNGLNIYGQWNLKIISRVSQRTGVIKSWGITITYNPVPVTAWQLVSTMNNSGIRCVYFLDANNGWMYGKVNNFGKMYRTTNGGTSWTITMQDTSSYNSINSIFFINSTTGFGCGGNGEAWKTTDGGQGWYGQQIAGFVNLSGIQFLNSSTGLICGGNNGGVPGVIYKTTDGGGTWTGGTISTFSYLECICFADASTAYAAGDFDIVKSVDGGNTWSTLITYGSVFRGEFPNIQFFNANTGYVAAGKDGILYTTNGGSNWQSNNPYPGFGTRGLSCTDINTCYIAGADSLPSTGGKIYKSTNHGLNWSLQLTVPYIYFGWLQFVDANTGFAGGVDNPQNQTKVVLYKTTTGGRK